jgi:hypothetical protein
MCALAMCSAVACATVTVEESRLAGQAELSAVEAQLAHMRELLASLSQQQAILREGSVEALYQATRLEIATWQPYEVPLPQSVPQMGPWYLAAYWDRRQFSPLEPVAPWVQDWIDLRRQDHLVHERIEGVSIALRRLERLRDRLRAQLGLPPTR